MPKAQCKGSQADALVCKGCPGKPRDSSTETKPSNANAQRARLRGNH